MLKPHTCRWCSRKSRFRHIFHHHSGWESALPGEKYSQPWDRREAGASVSSDVSEGYRQLENWQEEKPKVTLQKAHESGKNTRMIHGFQKFDFHSKLKGIPQQQHGKLRWTEIKTFWCVILYYFNTHAVVAVLINRVRTETWGHGVSCCASNARKQEQAKLQKHHSDHITSALIWSRITIRFCQAESQTKSLFFFFLSIKLIQHWLIRNNICGCGLFLRCKTNCDLRNAEKERENIPLWHAWIFHSTKTPLLLFSSKSMPQFDQNIPRMNAD